MKPTKYKESMLKVLSSIVPVIPICIDTLAHLKLILTITILSFTIAVLVVIIFLI